MDSLEDLQKWVAKSEKILIKKLSQNDCRWADGAEYGHQNGFYIPAELQASGFFPALCNENKDKPHIYETRFTTIWPSTGEIKESKLTHYSNKGREVHLTRVPRDEFRALTPASLLIGGVLPSPADGVGYWFMTIDSATEEAELVETAFDLGTDFHFSLFDPAIGARLSPGDADQLISLIRHHLETGTLADFIRSVATLPDPRQLAAQAQIEYMRLNGLSTLDPYVLQAPGDAIMKISRDIEFRLYKRAELWHRAAEVVRIVTSGNSDVVSSVVKGFGELDGTFLSASQHRKSRAGRSFEQHIARLLRDGRIPFEEQAVTGGRRPDFVVPSLAHLHSAGASDPPALVLSAKTTLRERWKQVTLEKFQGDLFLATVDDRVSKEAIRDMEGHGISLVVPESLKKSKETCYESLPNVITFRDFFDARLASQQTWAGSGSLF